MKKRILYVYNGKARESAGGLDLVVRQQLKALTDSGYEVTFISRGRYVHPLVNNIQFNVTPAHVFSSFRAKYYYSAQHRFFSFFASIYVRIRKFDIVFSWSRQSRSLFQSAKKTGARLFMNCPASYAFEDDSLKINRSVWPSINENYEKDELVLADVLLTPSEYARQSYVLHGYSSSSVFNIGRGADVARFHPADSDNHPFRLVFFGLVCDRKGISQALEAWRRAALSNAEFWIVGHVKAEASHYFDEMPDGVFLKGFSSSPEKYLQQCDVQILPTQHEGMAKSLVEGGASGLITITTRESGFPVCEGVTGYLVDRNDVDRMADLIRYLAENPVVRQEMAKKSREYVVNNLTWDMFRKRFVHVMEENLA